MTSSESFKTFEKFRQNKKVVFTNGCFDILHRGHVQYLSAARALGDLLVVGLNSDQSIKSLKGEERPINSLEDRKFVLEGLKSVDYVFSFSELTPLNLILSVKPDILVKGGDWKVEDIVGGKEVLSWGGEVKSLEFVMGKSTTDIINKIQGHD